MQGQANLYLMKVNTVYFSWCKFGLNETHTEISEIGPARMASAAPGPQRKTFFFFGFFMKS